MMRAIFWLTFVGLVGHLGNATAVADGPFNREVLKQAFEMRSCVNQCSNEAVTLIRLPLADGKVGFLIASNDRGYCGSRGCSSLVVIVSGNKFVTIKDGIGITREQAISLAAGNSTSQQQPSLSPTVRAVSPTVKQSATSLESPEGREFIQPVINYLRSRRYEGGPLVFECDKMIDYVGGSVLGRSIDGNVGVILLSLVGMNKGSIPLGAGGITAGLCGPASPEARPGEAVNIQVKGVFRKYDTGWRLEQVVTQ
jgi:hypothetical protein